METTVTFAACPTCGEYSNSIAGGLIEEACLHFEAMFCHRGDDFPTQHCFDQKTRDMAQRLLAALTTAHAETAALRAEVEKYQRELRIGDRVRVIGEYEGDWQGIDTWLVGINMDSEGLNYTIGEQWPVPRRFSIGYSGPTDGFREGQLARQAIKVQP